MSSRLKRTTYKVAGHEKRRLLQALVANRADLDALDKLIVSARVRRSAKSVLFRRADALAKGAAAPEPTQRQPAGAPPAPIADAAPKSETPAEPAGAFDPYGVPLVPTFQRGGADALAERLEAVVTVDQLRRMARAQQIALPADIRRGEVEPQTVRIAIVRAVEKRIADRRAAAG